MSSEWPSPWKDLATLADEALLVEDRDLVVGLLHWDGEFEALTTALDNLFGHSFPGNEMFSYHLYAHCDGFGLMDVEDLRGINDGWDWSHVRDSSPSALAMVAGIARDYIERELI
jgi:hypothetical protein